MSNFEFSIYQSIFKPQVQFKYLWISLLNTIPMVSITFSVTFGSKVIKANAGIAENSACQDLLYWN